MTSWAVEHPDFHALQPATTAVVAGTVAGVAAAAQDEGQPWPDRALSVFTEYILQVGRVAWDPRHAVSGDSILVRHPGGKADERHTVEWTDIPLFQACEAVISFLQTRPLDGLERFFAFGGGHPAGRHAVGDGMVFPATHHPLGAAVPAPEFFARLQQE